VTSPQRDTSDSLMATEQLSGRIQNKTKEEIFLTPPVRHLHSSLSTVKKLTQLRVQRLKCSVHIKKALHSSL